MRFNSYAAKLKKKKPKLHKNLGRSEKKNYLRDPQKKSYTGESYKPCPKI